MTQKLYKVIYPKITKAHFCYKMSFSHYNFNKNLFVFSSQFCCFVTFNFSYGKNNVLFSSKFGSLCEISILLILCLRVQHFLKKNSKGFIAHMNVQRIPYGMKKVIKYVFKGWNYKFFRINTGCVTGISNRLIYYLLFGDYRAEWAKFMIEYMSWHCELTSPLLFNR